MALEYLKELRQNGTDRRTELSTLISGGYVEYRLKKEAEEAEVSSHINATQIDISIKEPFCPYLDTLVNASVRFPL